MINQSDFNPGEGSLSLGRFAQAAGLTRKALRLYDQLGILVPDQVDPATGYRYYRLNQVERGRFIRLLREMEMPLADIRQVLSCEVKEEAVQLVRAWESDFVCRARRVSELTKKVTAYIYEEKEDMKVDVTLESFPEMTAVCLKKKITVPDFQDCIPDALQRLSGFVGQQGGILAGDPVCFYYGPVNQQDDGPVEICFPIRGKIQPGEGIQIKEIPAHQGAVARASQEQSKFPEILEVWDDLMTWVHHNKLRFSDQTVPCYEVWHEVGSISVVQPIDP